MIEKPPKFTPNEKNIPLVQELQVEGILQRIQYDYLYWDKVKYIAKGKSPEDVWSAVKLHRFINKKLVYFDKFSFSYLITDYLQKALHLFDMHIGGTLGSKTGIEETDKTRYMISSLMEEAISSSQMEGANTTRKRAKEMIQQDRKPKSKSELMIMNNFITMKHIVAHKDEDLSPEMILYIHKLMTNGTLENDDEEGRFRYDDEVHVVNTSNGETVHQPPLQSDIEALITSVCDFFNNDSDDFIHPIIKGCIIHFMIAWIHPFVDGNGRTARSLFYWYMLKKGYWLTEYLSISRIIKDTKNQYEKAFLYTENDDNDLSYFITYHIKTMEKAFDALKSYINKKQKEVRRAAHYMKIPMVNERMAQILKLLNDDGDRVLSSKEIQARFNVSSFTARSDLKLLVSLGYLEIIQVNKQKQNFIKSQEFDALIAKNTKR